ncbi:hypothetical protein J1614_004623 [Plenodomus biglobosus]|nr:hypothetical protein J1614_004623 [Plenodomus biglobosus]
MPYAPKPGDPITTLDTPSMLVDLDLMEANLASMMTLLLQRNISIRPHLKTSKSAILAHKMVAAGATGGCVAKLSEAEVMCAKGFSNLLITCEIVGAAKVRRFVELWEDFEELRIVVDSVEAARAIDDAVRERGVQQGRVKTLIDVDVGLHRTGVQAGAAALELARLVARCEGLEIIGVQGYEGHLQHVGGAEERKRLCFEAMEILTRTAKALRTEGHRIDVVTTGGTGTAEFCAMVPGVTEVQPGSFLFMDTDYRNALGTRYGNSLTILSTVLSKQGPTCVTIDVGLKSLTTDSGLAECKVSAYKYQVLGDEHGSLTWEDGKAEELKIGDTVEMIPSHIDPTINLHDVYYAHRNGIIEGIWPVDARGKVQ